MNKTACLTIIAVTFLRPHLLAAQDYVAGQTYFGRSNYVEYIAGNMPLIISAPHGGVLVPDELPDCTNGTTVLDSYTQSLSRQIYSAMTNQHGRHPHIIICRLSRTKIDCNRTIEEGAEGNPLTEISWNDFQNFIIAARQTVSNEFGRGFYIDLHSHGHTNQRIEVGYQLSSTELEYPDNTLDSGNYGTQSTIRELDDYSPLTFSALLRGSNSIGGLLAARGYPAVPSPAMPDPGGEPYFSGGYNTGTHGSRYGGTISGIQMELNSAGVRDTLANRILFASNLTLVLETYFTNNIGLTLDQGPPLLDAIPNHTLNAGQILSLTNTARDTDTPAQTFTYALTAAPSGATIDAASGLITWRPPVANGGTTNVFTVRVTDNGTPNLSDSRSFAVAVNPVQPPRLGSPAATNGFFSLLITGDAGPDYTVQTSTNLVNWWDLVTTNQPSLPLMLIDTNTAGFKTKFYRARIGP